MRQMTHNAGARVSIRDSHFPELKGSGDLNTQLSNLSLTTREFFFLGIYTGLSVELCIWSLVNISYKISKDTKQRFYKTGILMGIGNMACIVYGLSLIALNFATSTTCAAICIANNATSHVFYIAFDSFILYKCYHLSNRNKIILKCIIAILSLRFLFAIADLVRSYGHYLHSEGCIYSQNPLTGIIYNCWDLLIDCFVTAVTVSVSFTKLSVQSPYVKSLLKKNIIRSSSVVLVNSFLIYVSAYWTHPFHSAVAWSAQSYVIARCLNSDLFVTARNTTTQFRDSLTESRVLDLTSGLKVRRVVTLRKQSGGGSVGSETEPKKKRGSLDATTSSSVNSVEGESKSPRRERLSSFPQRSSVDRAPSRKGSCG